MARPSSKPVYLIPPGDPLITRYKEAFEQALSSKGARFIINVPPDIVREGHVAMLQEIILALQHYPECIETMLFNIELKFEQIAESELYYPDQEWIGNPKYMRWFNRIGVFPLTIFFLNNSEARFYTLAGDLLADHKFTVEAEKETGGFKKQKIKFEAEQTTLLRNRLYDSCWLLLMYCHGSGFYPKQYIESILADYSLPLHYEQIYKQYTLDIRRGTKLRAKGTNN